MTGQIPRKARDVLRRRPRAPLRSAYTLMELMLVLAILVAVAAASTPVFTGAMRNVKLGSSADIIRAELTKAHVRAMKTGRIQVFRFEYGGSKYSVQPWVGGDAEVESDLASLEMDSYGTSASLPPEETGAEQELPEGTLFASGESQMEGRSLRVAESVESLSSSSGQWSAPILFYPDGSASDAFVIVADDRQLGIRLDIRGVTGAVKVSEILPLADIESAQP